jgi:hypothetical protein
MGQAEPIRIDSDQTPREVRSFHALGVTTAATLQPLKMVGRKGRRAMYATRPKAVMSSKTRSAARELGAPIYCSLEAGERRARVAWIAALNRDALVSDVRKGHRLELVYAPEAAELVAEMVRRETACCPFLTFDLRSGRRQTKLVITAPPEAEDAEMLFTAFRSRG